MKTRYLLGAAALSAVAWSCAATAAVFEGRVYLDGDRNGKPDAGEPGVAGVLVSDGARVVATDAEGRYRIESTNASALVWVCLPRDRAASGAFWRRTDGQTREDFGLVPRPQTDDFAFVQISDSHIGRDDLLKRFAGHLGELPLPFAFVVNTGDLVGGVDTVAPDKALPHYDRYLGAAACFSVPLFHLPGNHEHVASSLRDADPSHPLYGKGLYRRVFGPTYYSWDWAGVHCVALDGTSLPYQEKLGAEQLAWLQADLGYQPAEKPLILFCHQSAPELRDAGALQAALRGRKVLGIFCGHLHRTFTARLGECPVYLCGAMSGSWWSGPNIDGTPQGFRLVRVKGGRLTTVFANREGGTPISIVAPLADTVLSGPVEVTFSVVDFGQEVELSGEFAGQPVALTRASREELWSIWNGRVDTRQAFDGDRTLKVTAKRGAEPSGFEIRYLVANGRAEAYAAAAPATLKLQVRKIDAPDEVYFNGERLGTIPKGTTNETVVAFEIGQGRLAKLNCAKVCAAAQGAGKDQFSIGPVWLEYRGKKVCDLRYASFERHWVVGDDPKRCEKELYFCLP